MRPARLVKHLYLPVDFARWKKIMKFGGMIFLLSFAHAMKF